LKRKIFEKKNALEMERIQREVDHRKAVQELEAIHSQKMNEIRRNLDSVMLGENHGAENGNRSFDNFLDSLRQTVALAEHTYKNAIVDTDPKGRDPELLSVEREIDHNEQRIGDLKRQIEYARRSPPIRQRERMPAVSEHMPAVSERRPAASEHRSAVSEHRSAVSELSAIDPPVPKVVESPKEFEFEAQKSELLKSHRSARRDLKNELRRAVGHRQQLSQSIAEVQGSHRPKRSRSARKARIAPRVISRVELVEMLGSLSPSEKEKKLLLMDDEVKALKREIARLDYMVYGKAGHYQEWKNL
jgi:hypothetical protein